MDRGLDSFTVKDNRGDYSPEAEKECVIGVSG